MTDASQIKPVYEDLQGRLSQLPISGDIERSVWEHYNVTVDKLSQVTGDDYGEYKAITKPPRYYDGHMIHAESYPSTELRTKMMGLVMKVYGQYFPLEQRPFSGPSSPGVVVSMNQQQAQATHIEMLFQFRDTVAAQLDKFSEGSKEKDFLKRIMRGVSNVRDAAELVKLVVDAAKTFALTADDITRALFS